MPAKKIWGFSLLYFITLEKLSHSPWIGHNAMEKKSGLIGFPLSAFSESNWVSQEHSPRL
ncbi:Hypothetical protein FKW44_006873, partial [Caligus rogercresseyi]